jgi:hypothetical protein
VTIFERVRALQLPKGEYALMGSALLDAWGLRPANDIDLIVTPTLYDELKRRGWEERRKENGFRYLSHRDVQAVSSSERHAPPFHEYPRSKQTLVDEAVLIRGVAFAPAEDIIAVKKIYGREVDLEDIRLMERYLASHPQPYEVAK